MKSSLLAPLFFLLSCLILLALTLAFLWMDAATALGQIQGEPSSAYLLWQIIAALPAFLPMVTALALFFAFIRLRKQPGIRPLTYIFLWAAAFAFLLAGTLGASVLSNRRPAEGPPAILWRSEGIQHLPLKEGIRSILVEGGEGENLEGILMPQGREDFQLAYYPRGSVTATEIVLEGKNQDVSLPFHRDHPFGNPMERNLHLEDFKRMGAGLAAQGGLQNTGIAIAAVTLYLVSCWGFIRVSRWNLFNIFFLLLLIRLSGLIYQVFSSNLAVEVIKLLPVNLPLYRLPFFALGIVGLALLLIDCLFIPYNRRVREEMDG